MKEEVNLESYLSALDRALSEIPFSERVEIIMDFKGKVLAAEEKHAPQTLQDILASMGTPEEVGNRYLLEKGFKVSQPQKGSTSIFKWFVIGALGTLFIISATIVFVFYRFTPLFSVTDKEVSFLGGAFKVEKDLDMDFQSNSDLKVPSGWGNPADQDGSDSQNSSVGEGKGMFEGSKLFSPSLPAQISILFSSGEVSLAPSSSKQISWSCRYQGSSPTVSEEGEPFVLNFKNTKEVKCLLSVPSAIKTILTGLNGQIYIKKPQGAIDVSLTNGSVMISPDSKQSYQFDLKIMNGRVGDFKSSTDKNAIQIKARVQNGLIEQD